MKLIDTHTHLYLEVFDEDRDEIIQRYIEDTVNNADYKDHGEMDYDMADMEEMKKLAGLI